MSNYTIREIAERYQITKRSIRYYEERGFMNIQRDEKGKRIYTEEDCMRIKLILLYREMDLPLLDIEELLKENKTKEVLQTILAKKKAEVITRLKKNASSRTQIEKIRASIINEKELKELDSIVKSEEKNGFSTWEVKHQLNKMNTANIFIGVYGLIFGLLCLTLIAFIGYIIIMLLYQG